MLPGTNKPLISLKLPVANPTPLPLPVPPPLPPSRPLPVPSSVPPAIPPQPPHPPLNIRQLISLTAKKKEEEKKEENKEENKPRPGLISLPGFKHPIQLPDAKKFDQEIQQESQPQQKEEKADASSSSSSESEESDKEKEEKRDKIKPPLEKNEKERDELLSKEGSETESEDWREEKNKRWLGLRNRKPLQEAPPPKGPNDISVADLKNYPEKVLVNTFWSSSAMSTNLRKQWIVLAVALFIGIAGVAIAIASLVYSTSIPKVPPPPSTAMLAQIDQTVLQNFTKSIVSNVTELLVQLQGVQSQVVDLTNHPILAQNVTNIIGELNYITSWINTLNASLLQQDATVLADQIASALNVSLTLNATIFNQELVVTNKIDLVNTSLTSLYNTLNASIALVNATLQSQINSLDTRVSTEETSLNNLWTTFNNTNYAVTPCNSSSGFQQYAELTPPATPEIPLYWYTRNLTNATSGNMDGIYTFLGGNNTLKLKDGTFRVKAVIPGQNVDGFQARIVQLYNQTVINSTYNATSGNTTNTSSIELVTEVIKYGTSEVSSGSQTYSTAEVTLTVTGEVFLQFQAAYTTPVVGGMGKPANVGGAYEVYTIVDILLISQVVNVISHTDVAFTQVTTDTLYIGGTKLDTFPAWVSYSSSIVGASSCTYPQTATSNMIVIVHTHTAQAQQTTVFNTPADTFRTSVMSGWSNEDLSLTVPVRNGDTWCLYGYIPGSYYTISSIALGP